MAGLWHHLPFRRLWMAKLVSSLGSQITFVALPLAAVLVLEASARQMGILTAAGTLPYLLLGLPAGAWVDRLPRRAVLVAADLGRALVLVSVPLAAIMGVLRIELLYLVAFLSGVGTLAFDVAEEAFLPSLVTRDRLVEGNSRLAAIDSVVTIAGPGAGGGLVQLLGAPLAILSDVVSFLASALLLRGIRITGAPSVPAPARANLWVEVGEGLRFLARQPLLRAVTATSATMQLFGGMFNALLALFLTRELGLPGAALGLLYAAGSASGLAAALAATRLTRRLGLGRVIVAAALAIGAGWLIVALAGDGLGRTVATLGAGILLAGMGNALYNINAASLAQTITPGHLLGRVNASRLFLAWGALPLGALLGGYLGQAIGLRPTVLLAGTGLASGCLWVFFSPVRGMTARTVLSEPE
jgi:MFS family permease